MINFLSVSLFSLQKLLALFCYAESKAADLGGQTLEAVLKLEIH